MGNNNVNIYYMQKFFNLLLLLSGVIVLMFLYQRMQEKHSREVEMEDYRSIREILQEQREDLAKTKKPIMWIHVPYEYNSRYWASFGSRGTFDLNQPYLYLTIHSIINKCSNSFRICIIDDATFEKLIPDWSINMNSISDPISGKIRTMGMLSLIQLYGGMITPISFLCLRDLFPLYTQGTQGSRMFVCEKTDRNATSVNHDFYPSLNFMGAPKNNTQVGELLEFVRRKISSDFTAESEFLGVFDKWVATRIGGGEVNMISGKEIGIMDDDGTPILIEDLMSSTPLKVTSHLYGLWIPNNEILSRRKYEWFSRMSIEQVLDANIILSKYIVMANIVDQNGGIVTQLKPDPAWVSFWSVPSQAPVWGLKPNYLGNNLLKLQEPAYAGN